MNLKEQQSASALKGNSMFGEKCPTCLQSIPKNENVRDESKVQAEDRAIQYFTNILLTMPNEASCILNLRYALGESPEQVKHYINQHYGGDAFESFFEDRKNVFILENNGRVFLSSKQAYAISYFKDIFLEKYKGSVLFGDFLIDFKRSPKDVKGFILDYASGRDFRKFIKSHPTEFTIDGEDFVELTWVVNEAVNFLKAVLLEKYSEAVPWRNLQGHLGQAPREVTAYISSRYGGENFLAFFEDHEDVFSIDENECIGLEGLEEAAVEYFKTVLIDNYADDVHFQGLHCQLAVAPPEVKWYFDVVYEDDFLGFFEGHVDSFNIDDAGNISYKWLKDAVEYFKTVLLEKYSESVNSQYLQGHLGQAPRGVINYFYSEYGNNFLGFFLDNPEHFSVDSAGNIDALEGN